ncbi:MAG: hypothetical protein DWQ36_06385 [Acidobacteria bacterium]|nr:MAG: hypothetical protein DWQ30_19390 [Acidobacteriota bacterium]REK09673.1 MAG: hypothetical protein DWQ36_06385 [Acidobacteriota bacterium]
MVLERPGSPGDLPTDVLIQLVVLGRRFASHRVQKLVIPGVAWVPFRVEVYLRVSAGCGKQAS